VPRKPVAPKPEPKIADARMPGAKP
jgi:hypothetical protein